MNLAIRRRAAIEKNRAAKAAVVAALAISSLFHGGCASFDTLGGGSLFGDAEVTRSYEDKLSLGLYAVAGIGPSRLEPDTSQVPALIRMIESSRQVR